MKIGEASASRLMNSETPASSRKVGRSGCRIDLNQALPIMPAAPASSPRVTGLRTHDAERKSEDGVARLSKMTVNTVRLTTPYEQAGWRCGSRRRERLPGGCARG